MSHPLLTVGIPTYNRATKLRSQVEGLLPHLGTNVDILVIDNGSTDETAQVLALLSNRSPSVRFTRNGTNLGCDVNYLRVIEQAQAAWCWLLGDDEPIDPSLLPALVERLRAETADAVHLRTPGMPFPTDHPARFDSHRYFAEHFYSQDAFQQLSANIFRSERAREVLREAYRYCGRLHSYTPIAMALMGHAGGLSVYDIPILKALETGEAPRWARVTAEIGAWETLVEATDLGARARVSSNEGGVRGRRMLRLAMEDILGISRSGLRWPHLRKMWSLFPRGNTPRLALVTCLYGLASFPQVLALLVVAVAGKKRRRVLKDWLGGGQDRGLRALLAERIKAAHAGRHSAANSEY